MPAPPRRRARPARPPAPPVRPPARMGDSMPATAEVERCRPKERRGWQVPAQWTRAGPPTSERRPAASALTRSSDDPLWVMRAPSWVATLWVTRALGPRFLHDPKLGGDPPWVTRAPVWDR